MAKKKSTSKKKQEIPYKFIFIGVITIVLVTFTVHYRHGINYWMKTVSRKLKGDTENSVEKLTKYDVRNIEVMDRYYLKTFGLDISQYQGDIDWAQMKTIYDIYPINFVFIRSTMGGFNTDKKFDENWEGAKQNDFIRGAYHFYRPDENSTAQAQNFIRNVNLKSGDLPPVLDIETMPRTQSMERLIEGLKNWCSIIEDHYGIQPIIYTSDKYFENFLRPHFEGYIIWIANYNFFVEDMKSHWNFWQFTEKAQIKGTSYKVDVNIYNGTVDGLKNLTL
ncbi:GH25 family lysozyme [Faecalibacter sp. LW9]|uniref:GH25 family lysozyme n=1 Tax=Faecalibacter sp. LW9 TaxID=3103144 RepID=UPI002B002B98|nr:GH25 family lysozyme [Faecalibacter sp. LW9]